MKNLIKCYSIVFIMWVVLTLMLYFSIAFSFYDLNAKNWSVDARDFMSFMFIGLFIIKIVIAIVWSLDMNKKQNKN